MSRRVKGTTVLTGGPYVQKGRSNSGSQSNPGKWGLNQRQESQVRQNDDGGPDGILNLASSSRLRKVDRVKDILEWHQWDYRDNWMHGMKERNTK